MRKAMLIGLISLLNVFSARAQGWVTGGRRVDYRDQMSNASVLIEAKVRGVKCSGTGTLFSLYRYEPKLAQCIGVLTVRHLVENADTISVSFVNTHHDKAPSRRKTVFTYTKDNRLVEYHPDSSVDLCLIIITKDVAEHSKKEDGFSYFAMDMTVLANDEVYRDQLPLDPVVMVGYPDGFVDDVNLQPVFRRGVYATRPSLDFKGKKEFLLDIQNNGGSNGSPVYRFDDGMIDERSKGGVNITLASRLSLVGISYDGVEAAKNKKIRAVFFGPPASTANVIKTDSIRELFDFVSKKGDRAGRGAL